MGIWPIVGFKKWHKDARGGKQAKAHYPENYSSRWRAIAGATETSLN